jgi:hypothetical protein
MVPLDDPVSSSDGILYAISNDATPRFHEMRNLNCSLFFIFNQKLVELFSEVIIEHFKSVLKKEFEESASAFHTFVAVVISVV